MKRTIASWGYFVGFLAICLVFCPLWIGFGLWWRLKAWNRALRGV